METIYLDNAATTPIDLDVLSVMQETGNLHFANPSSIHTSGQQSRVLIEKTRKTVAKAIEAKSDEIIFTSGGTESNNMALIGAATANQYKGNHIIVSRIEHPSVLESCKYLEKQGFTLSFVDVDKNGLLRLDQLQKLISKDTILVSLMLVNNETGSILPVRQVGEILKNKSVLFHTDAVQALDKIDLSVDDLSIDLLTLSAHKIYGPKGVGALYIRRSTEITNILHGGRQELNRRPGTENTSGIVGFGVAIEKIKLFRKKQNDILDLRLLLETELKKNIPGLFINAEESERIPSISNIYFPFMSGESLLINLDIHGIAVSTGSACSSGSQKPSHVLSAMGFDDQRVLNSIRFSLGRNTTRVEILKTVEILSAIFKKQ